MNRKEFNVSVDGKEVKLAIRRPRYDDQEEADKAYASKVAELIRNSSKKKILLKNELEDFLRKEGIWSSADDKKITDLQNQVDILLNSLRRGGIRLTEGRGICIDIMDKRRQIVELQMKRRVFDDATVESIADKEKHDYLVFSCTVNAESGKNYWNSFDDMKSEKFGTVYQEANAAFYDFVYNVNIEFEKRLPENRWLKKYNFLDDQMNYVDRKTGNKVDRDGRLIDDIVQEKIKEFNNLQGEIIEEQPFIDDDPIPVPEVVKAIETESIINIGVEEIPSIEQEPKEDVVSVDV